jgi:hypothetical protein
MNSRTSDARGMTPVRSRYTRRNNSPSEAAGAGSTPAVAQAASSIASTRCDMANAARSRAAGSESAPLLTDVAARVACCRTTDAHSAVMSAMKR